jgi:catechol 2,3-dioxygenase-like lactoylglutathione lyase family enzyme
MWLFCVIALVKFITMNLNQVTVAVSDISRAVEFYKKLGLQPIVLSPHYARFIFPEGDATFSVQLSENMQPQSGTHVYFEVEDPDAKIAALKLLDIVAEEQPEDKPWLWREARLKDPDGNTIIIYYAGENRVNPPWRIS